MYRPGPRTGRYAIHKDEAPMLPGMLEGREGSADEYEGRLLGVSAADLAVAVAVADEAEKGEKVGWHWSATAELPEDRAVGSYATLS